MNININIKFKLLFFSFFIFGLISKTFSKTLIISDSHGVGAFGLELTRYIENKNESVSFYAYGGSNPADWIEGNKLPWSYWEHHTSQTDQRSENKNTPKLSVLIETQRPDSVIIVLGTNLIWREQLPEDTSQIEYLINLVKKLDLKCIWIGPPDLRLRDEKQIKRLSEIQNQLRQIVSQNKCMLIESWTFTTYPPNIGDGIHYDQIPKIGYQLSQKWAHDVFYKIYLAN